MNELQNLLKHKQVITPLLWLLQQKLYEHEFMTTSQLSITNFKSSIMLCIIKF